LNEKRRKIWLLLPLAVAAFVAGGLLSVRLIRVPPATTPAVPTINGTVLPEPRPLSPFELVAADGSAFTPKDFQGHWSFVYFGYTYCPDVCPLTMVELADVKQRLAKDVPGLGEQYYLVSVDPARDTPDRMGEYVGYFDPEFHGLTGKDDEISKFAKQVGAFYLKPSGQDQKSYVVSHSSTITVIDPEGRFHAVFSAPHQADQVAADFAKILAHYRETAAPKS
jgi:protein SCO1/2